MRCHPCSCVSEHLVHCLGRLRCGLAKESMSVVVGSKFQKPCGFSTYCCSCCHAWCFLLCTTTATVIMIVMDSYPSGTINPPFYKLLQSWCFITAIQNITLSTTNKANTICSPPGSREGPLELSPCVFFPPSLNSYSFIQYVSIQIFSYPSNFPRIITLLLNFSRLPLLFLKVMQICIFALFLSMAFKLYTSVCSTILEDNLIPWNSFHLIIMFSFNYNIFCWVFTVLYY